MKYYLPLVTNKFVLHSKSVNKSHLHEERALSSKLKSGTKQERINLRHLYMQPQIIILSEVWRMKSGKKVIVFTRNPMSFYKSLLRTFILTHALLLKSLGPYVNRAYPCHLLTCTSCLCNFALSKSE